MGSPSPAKRGCLITFLQDFPIYYERYGQGTELVFLHGYTCSLEHWRWTADLLSSSYRVLLFDMRCHGRSGKNTANLTLNTLVDETRQLLLLLGVEKPVLIGHSMGGMVALEYALRYTSQVRALVLAEAHTHLDTTTNLLGPGVLDARTPAEIAREIQVCMNQGEANINQELLGSLLAFDARAQVGNLTCPVLCLWGDRYGDISPGQWPQILEAFGYARLPNLVFHSIPNSHHFIMLEQPRETLQAIQDFLSNL